MTPDIDDLLKDIALRIDQVSEPIDEMKLEIAEIRMKEADNMSALYPPTHS